MWKKWKQVQGILAAVAISCSMIGSPLPVQAAENEPVPILSVSCDQDSAADESGHDHHGVLAGNVQFVDGYHGRALSLRNSDDQRAAARQYVIFIS